MKFKKLFCAFSALCLLLTAADAQTPANILLMEGETRVLDLNPALVTPASNQIKVKSQNGDYALEADASGKYDLALKLFGVIPYKTVTVNVMEKMQVVPCGKTVGIKIYSKGLICVGLADLSAGGQQVCPARDAGISVGDVVLRANGQAVESNEALAEIVNKCEDTVELTIMQQDKEKTVPVQVVEDTDGSKKIGLWVRDSVAGVGTITFYDPATNFFGALGHPISDTDTGKMFEVAEGELTGCEIVSIQKGEKGAPGELRGRFTDNVPFADILVNTPYGIFGTAYENFPEGEKPLPIGFKGEVRKDRAYILSNISGSKVEKYEIEIQHIFNPSAQSGKDMLIKVTDKRLLEQTGGIVQGMSGSPIVQNGKLIGAVTHVFVNDPTRGYGIFIENMLQNMHTEG